MSLKRDCKPFLHDVLALDPMGLNPLGHVKGVYTTWYSLSLRFRALSIVIRVKR